MREQNFFEKQRASVVHWRFSSSQLLLDSGTNTLADVVVYDDAAAVTTVVIKDIGNEGIDDEEGNSGDDELLQYGKARLKERNKKVVNSGQVLKRDIKRRLAHKANNKKGHNKKSKNSNGKQKSKKKGR
jgi:hypothetical protein